MRIFVKNIYALLSWYARIVVRYFRSMRQFRGALLSKCARIVVRQFRCALLSWCAGIVVSRRDRPTTANRFWTEETPVREFVTSISFYSHWGEWVERKETIDTNETSVFGNRCFTLNHGNATQLRILKINFNKQYRCVRNNDITIGREMTMIEIFETTNI